MCYENEIFYNHHVSLPKLATKVLKNTKKITLWQKNKHQNDKYTNKNTVQ